MKDEEILERIAARDYGGLEGLIDSYGSSIIKTIRSILSTSYEKNYWEEVENEVFYLLWQQLTNYDPSKSSLITYVLTITRNKTIDRKRQLMKELAQEEVSETLVAENEARPLAKEEFLGLLDQLNEVDQRIFLFFYFFQEPPEQIAALVGMDTSAVYNHLSRGRAKLKSIFTERGAHS